MLTADRDLLLSDDDLVDKRIRPSPADGRIGVAQPFPDLDRDGCTSLCGDCRRAAAPTILRSRDGGRVYRTLPVRQPDLCPREWIELDRIAMRPRDHSACSPAAAHHPRTMGRGLHVVLNLVGPVAFVTLYAATGQLIDGTWGLLGGSALSLLATYAVVRRIAPMPLVLGILALIFGGLTLIFHSVGFLKLEVTIRSAAVGLTLLATLMVGLNPLKMVAGGLFQLTDAAWRTIGMRFGLLNVAIAALNLVVWRTQSDAVWAAFKFPGLLLLHGVFLASQLPLLVSAHREVTDRRER